MPKLEAGCLIEADRGPDCLFVKLHASDECPSADGELADRLWDLLQQHLTHRLVIEMDEFAMVPPSIMGDLVALQERIQQHGGLMRLCGMSERCRQAMRLDNRLPHYENREAALMGMRPHQPR